MFPSLLPQGSHCGPAFRVEVWTGARSLVGGLCTMHHQLFCWNSHEHNEMQRMCGGRYPAKKLQTRYKHLGRSLSKNSERGPHTTLCGGMKFPR